MKVGDEVRVLSVKAWQHDGHGINVGDVGYIDDIEGNCVGVKISRKTYCVYFRNEQLELLNKPKRYTLTEYVKPKTVTIDGIEYVMTEVVE